MRREFASRPPQPRPATPGPHRFVPRTMPRRIRLSMAGCIDWSRPLSGRSALGQAGDNADYGFP
jgi:hypothetical protein